MKISFVRVRAPNLFANLGMINTEPLELEYLAAFADKNNWKYRMVDECLGKIDIEKEVKKKPDVVAFTGYITQVNKILEYSKKIKKLNPDIKIVVGGVHADLFHEDYYSMYVDYIVYSGGPFAFEKLIDNIINKKSLKNLSGICYKDNGKWIVGKRMTVKSKELPLPNRTHFYKNIKKFRYFNYKSAAIVKTSFGCPYSCTFCCCRKLNNSNYEQRNVREVVDEIKSLKTDNVWIIDDTFLVNKARLDEFIDIVTKENIKKNYIIYGRSDFLTQKNEDFIMRLKSIGLKGMIVGLESISNRKLSKYHKDSSLKKNVACIKLMKKYKVDLFSLFIMDVDATKEDFKELNSFIWKYKLRYSTLSVFTPFPGTDIYPEFKDKLITSNRDKWDFLHLVIKPVNLTQLQFYFQLYYSYFRILLLNMNFLPEVTIRLYKYLIRKHSVQNKKKAIWDFWANKYEKLWVQKYSLTPTRKKVVFELKKILPKIKTKKIKILDLGCGTGQLLRDVNKEFSDYDLDLYGVDVSSKMIDVAKVKSKGIKYYDYSIEELNSIDFKGFDIILCTHSFPYYNKKKSMIFKISDMMKSNGYFIISNACEENLYDKLFMPIIKFTTSKAVYPSVSKMIKYLQTKFNINSFKKIQMNKLIPTIGLFVCRKKARKGF